MIVENTKTVHSTFLGADKETPRNNEESSNLLEEEKKCDTVRLSGFIQSQDKSEKCKLYLNENYRKIVWRTWSSQKKKKDYKEVSISMDNIIGIKKTNTTQNTLEFTLWTFTQTGLCPCILPPEAKKSYNYVKGKFLFQIPIHENQSVESINLFLDLFNKIMYSGEGTKRPRKVIAILNPYGGHMEARSIYNSVVRQMLEQANIEILYYETKSSIHITKIAKKIDVNGVHGIVCIGGDGLINQLVNGFMTREDASRVMAVPIGLIPAGSQNALAISIIGFKTNEEYTFAIIRGKTRGLDIIDAYYPETQMHVYSLITVAYGFIGDVLQESEIYRWMGPSRYQYCAVKQFFKNKAYIAQISYAPPDTTEEMLENEENWITLDYNEFDLACSFNISGQSTQTPKQVPALCDDGLITMLLLKRSSPIDTVMYLLHAIAGTHDRLDFVKIIKAKSVKLVPNLLNSSPMNIDGELQPTATVVMKTLASHTSLFVTE